MSDTTLADWLPQESLEDYLQRQFAQLHRRIDTVTDVLAGLTVDADELAAIIPALVKDKEAVAAEVAALKKRLEEGGAPVNATELTTIDTGLKGAISTLKGLLPAEQPPVNAPSKTVYIHTGQAAVDGTQWTDSGYLAAPANAGEPAGPELWYFAGDTAAGQTNGTSPEWSPYTGATEPKPAPAAGAEQSAGSEF